MLNLTDEQIKDLSLTTLQLPFVISDPVSGAGLVQQQEALVANKASLGELDTQNKIFTDHWITVLSDYYTEREKLNRVTNTSYNEATLILGGKNEPPHYTATWLNLVPIVSDNVKGLPAGVGATPDEDELISSINPFLDLMLNGFTDGAVEETTATGLDNLTDSGFEVDSGSGFSVGNRIIIDNGTVSLFATITSLVVPPMESTADIGFSYIGGTIGSSITAPVRVRNFHAGFNNSERGHQTNNYAKDVMVYYQNSIDPIVSNWSDNLNIQQSALTNNGDLIPANQATNSTALSNVDDALTDLDSWEAIDLIDVNGRFTDTTLLLVTDSIASRPAQISARVTAIGTNLGPLTQAPDGSVTGSGAYASLYEFINIRIARVGGTLFGFNSADLTIDSFDTKIANAQGQLDQYQNTFAIASLLADTIVGQIDFEVDSVAEFSVSQTVKVMDNDSVVFTRTISAINGTTITLNAGVVAALTINSIARIVRQK